MQRGSLVAQYADRTNPLGKHLEVMNNKRGITKVSLIVFRILFFV